MKLIFKTKKEISYIPQWEVLQQGKQVDEVMAESF